MRTVLVLALVYGLVPALGEVAEAVVHYAVEGHLAHTAEDRGDLGDLGDEHGCGTTQHRCDCCASQALAAPPRASRAGPSPAAARWSPHEATLASLHAPAPPLRPPIAS